MRQILPDALDLMVACIRAGHSVPLAMSMAAKESPEPFDEQNYGLDLRAALWNLQFRASIREIRMIVTAILLQAETGGNLTEILEKVAYVIRENTRLRQQVRVHTAQGRISGWILTIMPVVLGFLLYLVNPAQMSLLWTTEAGRKLMYTSFTMTTIGALVIRKIVRVRI
jgi:tight adherence protein B